MKAEIIAVGTELLLGQIVNTNARHIARGCADIGLDVYVQTVVGDNRGRIAEAFRLAASRADVVLATGGLGPTQDDITKDALAELLGLSLHLHQPSMDKITEMFRSRGMDMVKSNERQALILEGSTPLANDNGLAVGVGVTLDDTHYVLMPGPPREMKQMFDVHVIPWLQAKLGQDAAPLYSRMLKFAGIGESSLEDRLIELIDEQDDPTIAPYAGDGDVSVRLTTRASSQAEANRKLDRAEQAIRELAGEYVYANRDVPLEQRIVELLIDSGKTVATAESCTGGLVSELLTAIPGSSQALRGGFVCYTNAAKHSLLGVPLELLEGPDAPGAISEQTARVLAESARERLDSDFGISVTGVAGPAESEGKPVGLVFVGIAKRGEETQAVQLQLFGDRDGIRLRAAKQTLVMLWRRLD